MARIRTIKPEFFASEQVAQVAFEWRLLFIGLWTHADREGRLLDRPQRLKAMLFPYDSLNVEDGLQALATAGLITRYAVGGTRLIAIPTWLKHQQPHAREIPSTLPGPSGDDDSAGPILDQERRARIYERDGHRCVYCGVDVAATPSLLCIDHVVPRTRGGTHTDANLVTACQPCNNRKGTRLPDECGLPWPKGRGEAWTGNDLLGSPTYSKPALGKGREQEQEGKEGSPAPLRDATPAVRVYQTVGAIPTWTLTEAQVTKWQSAYPALDIVDECRRAETWLEANQGRRKTAAGMPRFLVSWFNRANDRGGNARQVAAAPARAVWRCPHAEQCAHRAMCDHKTLIGPAKYPLKAVAS